MTLNEIFENNDNLIRERIEYIFASFQKFFPEIYYSERTSIVGIGEPNTRLMCYFGIKNNKIYVKFKSNKSHLVLEDISLDQIDLCITETIKLFQNNELTLRKKRSQDRDSYKKQKDNDDRVFEIGLLLEEVALTNGSVVIKDIASVRLTNALYRKGVIKISDLSGLDTQKLLKIRHFGIACLEELFTICCSLKKDISEDIAYKCFLSRKASKRLMEKFVKNEDIQNYLISIGFDETLFEEGTFGRILCLRSKITKEPQIFFSTNQMVLQEEYLLNYSNFEQIFTEYQTLLEDIICQYKTKERDKDITLKMLGFDGNNYTLAAVGKMYDISRERVRQIFSKTIKRLTYTFNLYTEQGIINYNARNNFLLKFSSFPVDSFMLYLVYDKNEYLCKAFAMLLLNGINIPNNLQSLLKTSCKLLKRGKFVETSQDTKYTLSKQITAKELLELTINACKQINKVYAFGATVIVNVLRGSKNKKIIKYKLNELDCYGILTSMKTELVFSIIQFLIKEDYLYSTRGLRPTIWVNAKKSIQDINSLDLSKIEEIISLNNAKTKPQTKVADDGLTIVVDGWQVYVDAEDGLILTDIELLKRLQVLRKKIGDEKHISYFMVAWNRVLVQLATKKPTTKEEFLSIKGIKYKWFDSYGQAFMEEIKNYIDSK